MRNQMVKVGGIAFGLAILFIGWTFIQPMLKISTPESNVEELKVDQSKIERARESNPHFKIIDDRINQMEKNGFTTISYSSIKNTYNQIKIEINAKATRNLLNLKEKNLLSEKLDLVHIPILKSTLKKFFSSSSQVADFNAINQELQVYGKGKYHPNVQDMLKPANDFSRLLKTEKETRGITSSINPQESNLESLYQIFLSLETKSYLSSCRLAKNISNENKALLEDKMVWISVNALQDPIEKYVTNNEFNSTTTEDFLNKINALRNHRRIAARKEIRNFCDQTQGDLEGLKNCHEKFNFYASSTESCESAFGKYGYYVKKCKESRAVPEVKQN